MRNSQFELLKKARQARPLVRELPSWIDVAAWPLVLATMTATDESSLDAITALYAKGHFALVCDIRGIPPATPESRHLAAAARAANEERWPTHCVGTALVVNGQQRSELAAVDWLAPSERRRRAFDDIVSATTWAMDKVTAAGLVR
ncbi:MAG: hypothetical protein Q8O67_34380 [Deltaproteobacteria bacterium]|nr:hypothetical protein [Deltaproteobacteria bacterium]